MISLKDALIHKGIKENFAEELSSRILEYITPINGYWGNEVLPHGESQVNAFKQFIEDISNPELKDTSALEVLERGIYKTSWLFWETQAGSLFNDIQYCLTEKKKDVEVKKIKNEPESTQRPALRPQKNAVVIVPGFKAAQKSDSNRGKTGYRSGKNKHTGKGTKPTT